MQQPRVKNTSDAGESAGCAVRYDRHTHNFAVQKVDTVFSSCCYYPGNDILCNKVSTFDNASTGLTVSSTIIIGSVEVGHFRFCLAKHYLNNNWSFKPRALYFLLSVCFESEAAMPDSRMNHSFESILFDESLKRGSAWIVRTVQSRINHLLSWNQLTYWIIK